jgi:hypothetical protein
LGVGGFAGGGFGLLIGVKAEHVRESSKHRAKYEVSTTVVETWVLPDRDIAVPILLVLEFSRTP